MQAAVAVPGDGARHVRHRKLPAGLRAGAGARDRGRALGRHRGLPHGRVRRGGTGPPGRLPALDPGAHRRAGPPEGRLLRGGPRRRRGGVPPLQPASCSGTRSTCAASGSARTGTWPSTTRPWPTSPTRSTSRWSSSRRPAAASRSTRATSPASTTFPTHAITVTIPALLRAGRVLAIVPEARKAASGGGRPDGADHHGLPRIGPAHDLPGHGLSRA